MALSASARTKKSQLKKQGYTDVQAMNYLMEHGYIKVIQKEKAFDDADHNSSHKNPSAGNDDSQESEPIEDITEDVWKACILRLVNESKQMTPQICDKVRDYLDMKDKITKPPRALLPPQESDALGFSS